jgi:hypothetical protein
MLLNSTGEDVGESSLGDVIVGDWDADEMGWGVEDRARRCSERDVNLVIEVWLVLSPRK